MRVLITGANGFVGRHMAAELVKSGHDVIKTELAGGGDVLPLDVSSRGAAHEVFKNCQPDAVVHLAGLSHTRDSASNIDKLFDVNVGGVANVCSAMGALGRDRPRSVLMISSAFVYGGDHPQGRHFYHEASPTIARGEYGLSKLAAEAAARMYDSAGLHVYCARPFNHIGPGQDVSFVVPGFANRIARCPNGGSIETGNLTAMRDLCDVRDVVRGYRLILEKRPAERCFVFGSGQGIMIQDVLGSLVSLSSKRIQANPSASLVRSNDDSELLADCALAHRVLGWKAEISLTQSLTDVWEEFRPVSI